jgi:hypothetical protein
MTVGLLFVTLGFACSSAHTSTQHNSADDTVSNGGAPDGGALPDGAVLLDGGLYGFTSGQWLHQTFQSSSGVSIEFDFQITNDAVWQGE